MTRSLSLLVLAAILMAGSSCLVDYRDYELELQETRSWLAAGVSEFSAETGNGAVTVTVPAGVPPLWVSAEVTRSCTGKDSADAAANIDRIVVTDETTETSVSLRADIPNDPKRDHGASFDVTMPTGIAVDLKTANGEVNVVGTMSDVEVKTTNGGIMTDETLGRLTLHSTNGDVTVTDHQGSAEAGTSNGDIDCSLELPEPTQSADLETTNGQVTLTLPADAAVTFDARTTNGSVTVQGFADVDYTTNEPTHKAGTIGGGGAEVDISTSNGNVTVKAE
jgi:hypothetical protein